jgi:hypothetical protein
MKIIISEDQQKVLLESKQIDSVQNLVDMAVEDYVEGCSRRHAFRNLELALCKGFKNGTTKLKVLEVKKIHDHYDVKLSIHTDQEWFQRADFQDFEITLILKVANIIGTHKYGFDIKDMELNDRDEEVISESREMSTKLRRRFSELEKIGESIEYQTEIQDPCDFEDENDYADYCIGQGLYFYYNDDEDEDYEYPPDEMVEVRDEVEEYLEEKYHNYLVDIYNDLVENCN